MAGGGGIETATTTTQSEIIELETRYGRAMQEKDVDTALRLTANPCLIAASGVASVNHET